MAHLPLILIAWAISTATFVGLLIYQGHLTRQEVDVVFLSESPDHHQEQDHDDIVRRVDHLQPFIRTAGGAAILCTLLAIGVYVAALLPTVHF